MYIRPEVELVLTQNEIKVTNEKIKLLESVISQVKKDLCDLTEENPAKEICYTSLKKNLQFQINTREDLLDKEFELKFKIEEERKTKLNQMKVYISGIEV